MGMSPDASIGYGIDLGGGDMGYHKSLKKAMAEREESIGGLLENLDEVLGFDEPFPEMPEHLKELSHADRQQNPAFRVYEAKVDAYRERREKAIPVESEFYGYIDYCGWVLITKRSYQRVNWACDPIGMQQMFVPFDYETEALGKVLDSIGYTGKRKYRWLLWASYG
jgi:hypothetical protein